MSVYQTILTSVRPRKSPVRLKLGAKKVQRSKSPHIPHKNENLTGCSIKPQQKKSLKNFQTQKSPQKKAFAPLRHLNTWGPYHRPSPNPVIWGDSFAKLRDEISLNYKATIDIFQHFGVTDRCAIFGENGTSKYPKLVQIKCVPSSNSSCNAGTSGNHCMSKIDQNSWGWTLQKSINNIHWQFRDQFSLAYKKDRKSRTSGSTPLAEALPEHPNYVLIYYFVPQATNSRKNICTYCGPTFI